MTKYLTGNSVGSADPRDLHDNATVADRLVNGGADFYPDRLGVNRRSWASVQGEAEAFFESSGYEFVGDYAAGIELTRYSQVVRDTSGEFWRVSGSTTLPYTTTGAGLPEGGAFVSVGDAALRQDLVQPVATYNNVADMKAASGLGTGRKARTLGYYTPGDGGGNDYEIVAGATGTADGGSFIDLDNGLQAKGLFANGSNANQWGAGSGDASGLADTAAIQAYWDWSNNNTTIKFNPETTYFIKSIAAPCSRRKIIAYGARFVLTQDGTEEFPVAGFDLNPDADPVNPELGAKAFCYWTGGEFLTNNLNAKGTAAIKAFAIRQLSMHDVIFSSAGQGRLSSGILLAGLGGHKFYNNRFQSVKIGFDCPDWSEGEGAGVPISTSEFVGNEFQLGEGARAFDVRGGANRWKIWGGFSNGSENSDVIRFQNSKIVRHINFKGIGLESLTPNSRFVYFQDSAPLKSRPSNIIFEDIEFNGNPAGGGAVGVDIERADWVQFSGSCRFDQNQANGNYGLVVGPECKNIEIVRATRIDGSDLLVNCLRRNIWVGPSESIPLNSKIYNLGSFSTGEFTADMSSLMGSQYPAFRPSGYTLTVIARDSGSSTIANRGVLVGRSLPLSLTEDYTLSLDSIPDNKVRSGSVFVQADENGNIAFSVFASGTETLELTVLVEKTHG